MNRGSYNRSFWQIARHSGQIAIHQKITLQNKRTVPGVAHFNGRIILEMLYSEAAGITDRVGREGLMVGRALLHITTECEAEHQTY